MFKPYYSGKSFNFQNILIRKLPVPDIPGKASYAIAAHLDLAAVRIEYSHFKISQGRETEQQELISANAESPVAEKPGKFSHIKMPGEIKFPTVNDNKVIARAVHFTKSKFHD